MGLPAKRRTKQSKRERASHFALKSFTLAPCSHCKRNIAPHRVCPHCGWYRGREVVKIKITSKVGISKKQQAKDAAAEEKKG